MFRTAAFIAPLLAASITSLAGVQAQEMPASPEGYMAAPNDPAAQAMPADYAAPPAQEQEGPPPPIPPYVEGPAVAVSGGGYCFEGAHPVDSRVEPGVTWDNTPGRHMHGYPPFDLRLFNYQNGCYYFIGDPTDFGYAGNTFSYYGAHPILGAYGGGWCFMIGPHRHFWRPWSPMFVTVGSWFYWEGPYDPFFWTYWPYYQFYYRSHYPTYYARGAFFRGHMVAPRIMSVPRPVRGAAWQGAGGNYRAAPMSPRGGPAPGVYRAAPMAPHGAAPAPTHYRAAPMAPHGAAPMMAPHGGGPAPGAFRAAPSAPSGGFAPHNFSAPASRSGGGGAHVGGGHFGGHGRR
jgi:hypothetical protein